MYRSKSIKSKSLVSVIISAKKFDSFFSKAMRSIKNQTYKNIEVILTVESDYITFSKNLKKIFQKKIPYKIIKNKIPGFSHGLNVAIEKSKGEFLVRMDTDDLSHRDRILKQVNFINKNPEYSVVGTGAYAIDELGYKIKHMKLKYYQTNREIRNVLPYRNPIYHSSVLLKKSIFLQHGAYKYDYYAQDHELWIRLSLIQEIKFYNLPDVLYFYRRHDDQETNMRNMWRAFYEISGFLFRYFLITKNFKFIFGILVVFPFFRIIKQKIFKLR
jgi:glycosyltransferase involved in cell wall biosynthesis